MPEGPVVVLGVASWNRMVRVLRDNLQPHLIRANIVQISDVALREPAFVLGKFLFGRAHQVVITMD